MMFSSRDSKQFFFSKQIKSEKKINYLACVDIDQMIDIFYNSKSRRARRITQTRVQVEFHHAFARLPKFPYLVYIEGGINRLLDSLPSVRSNLRCFRPSALVSETVPNSDDFLSFSVEKCYIISCCSLGMT